MSQKTQIIGEGDHEKLVLISRPYELPHADGDPGHQLVGRQHELEMITAAWMSPTGRMPLSPLLLGEPGVGKNRIVYEIARRTAKDLYIFQGHEDVTAEDLACAIRFSDNVDRRMDYVASPLVTAMLKGGICFIDEIAKIRPRALALLVSVLDERRYIDSTLLGERVHAHPGFRFVAATNTADLEGNAMPEFLRSRLRPIISVGHPASEEINAIIRDRHPRLGTDGQALIDMFWMQWEKLDRTHPPTPRDAIYVFDLALSLADFEGLGGQEALRNRREIQLDTAGTAQLGVAHLECAFNELFRQNMGSS